MRVALPDTCDHMYGAEEAVPIVTLLEILLEYLAVDGYSRAYVACHALVVRQLLFVNDVPVFVDCALLVDVERGDQDVKDVEDCVPGDD